MNEMPKGSGNITFSFTFSSLPNLAKNRLKAELKT